MKEINIVLVKAEWCGHCKSFQPIFKLSEEKIKENSYFRDKKTNYEIYDIEKENERKSFINKYDEERLNKIEGYPSVFITILDKNNVIKFEEVNTTRKQEGKTSEDAAINFINNLEVKLKTILSENKDEFINTQSGGGNINYRNKYIKYKDKYLKLKKEANNFFL